MNNTTQECSELYHHGILGMKWGVRRFQNKDGSLTTAGKKRYDSDGDESSGETKKKKFSLKKSGSKEDTKNTASKEDESEQKKIPSKEEDPETYEAAKQKAIKTGSATDVLKFKGDLTQQEMQSAISRIRWEQDMATLSAKETTAGKTKADEFFDKVKKGTEYADTGIKAYNTAANVYNAFNKEGKLLPKISTNITNDNRNERKTYKKEKEKEAEAKKKREKQEAEGEAKRQERAAKKNKEPDTEDVKTDTQPEKVSGTVEGVGTSSRKNSSSEKSNANKDDWAYDLDGWANESSNTHMSDISPETISIGKAKVEQFLLEEKGR